MATRGEGWGMPLSEAMAMGLPVVVTNWSGPVAFVDESVGYPVNYTLVEVRGRHFLTRRWPGHQGSCCFEAVGRSLHGSGGEGEQRMFVDPWRPRVDVAVWRVRVVMSERCCGLWVRMVVRAGAGEHAVVVPRRQVGRGRHSAHAPAPPRGGWARTAPAQIAPAFPAPLPHELQGGWCLHARGVQVSSDPEEAKRRGRAARQRMVEK